MCDKKHFIEMYFKDWKNSFEKAKTLLNQKEYYVESIIILCCYIGSLASLRYPNIKTDGEKYKKVVLEYSGMEDLYNLVDLLFFYQWPRSDYKHHGEYKKLRNHAEIVNIFVAKYGDEEKIKNEETRYISQNDFINELLANPFPELNQENITQYLPLFSLCEMFYRYMRCYAVHNVSFPFVNKGQTVDGKIIYQDNHKITGQVVLKTAENILNNLQSECLDTAKWPYQL